MPEPGITSQDQHIQKSQPRHAAESRPSHSEALAETRSQQLARARSHIKRKQPPPESSSTADMQMFGLAAHTAPMVESETLQSLASVHSNAFAAPVMHNVVELVLDTSNVASTSYQHLPLCPSGVMQTACISRVRFCQLKRWVCLAPHA